MATRINYKDPKMAQSERILRNYRLIQIQADSAREAREEEMETRITSQLRDIVVQTSGISDKVGDIACRLATKSKAERQLEIIDKFVASLSTKDKEIVNRNIIGGEKIFDLSIDYNFGMSERSIVRRKEFIISSFVLIIYSGDKLNRIFEL